MGVWNERSVTWNGGYLYRRDESGCDGYESVRQEDGTDDF